MIRSVGTYVISLHYYWDLLFIYVWDLRYYWWCIMRPETWLLRFVICCWDIYDVVFPLRVLWKPNYSCFEKMMTWYLKLLRKMIYLHDLLHLGFKGVTSWYQSHVGLVRTKTERFFMFVCEWYRNAFDTCSVALIWWLFFPLYVTCTEVISILVSFV